MTGTDLKTPNGRTIRKVGIPGFRRLRGGELPVAVGGATAFLTGITPSIGFLWRSGSEAVT